MFHEVLWGYVLVETAFTGYNMDILVKREVAEWMLGPFQVESILESP